MKHWEPQTQEEAKDWETPELPRASGQAIRLGNPLQVLGTRVLPRIAKRLQVSPLPPRTASP